MMRSINIFQELSGFLYFIIGAIAKTVATVVTYPLQVVQSKSRVGTHITVVFIYPLQVIQSKSRVGTHLTVQLLHTHYKLYSLNQG